MSALLYHIVPGSQTAEQLLAEGTLATELSNVTLSVSLGGSQLGHAADTLLDQTSQDESPAAGDCNLFARCSCNIVGCPGFLPRLTRTLVPPLLPLTACSLPRARRPAATP